MHPAQQAHRTAERHKRGRLGKPRLLIVGCGDIGSRIVARLAGRFRIFGLNSTGARAPALRAAGGVPLRIDLDRGRQLDGGRAQQPGQQRDGAALRGVRGVRGLASQAYLMHLAPPPGSGRDDPRTRRLLAAIACGTRPPQRVVYLSTTGVYGDRGGARINETAPAAPATARARRRIDAEARVRRAPWHATVLRAPGIYAADRLPLERLRRRLPVLLASEDVYTNHIHADDLARLCIAALARGGRGRVYNAVDDTELKMGDFLDLVAQRHGLPAPPRATADEVRKAVSEAMWSFMAESRRISNRRIGHERLRYPNVHAGLPAAAPTERIW